MAQNRNGSVILVQLAKHICRVLVTWRTKIDAVIDAAVAASTITSAQATTLKNWLDAAEGACAILRLVTGY